ncbi:helix-turn-helix transcriptional regulator [Paenibacillus validus]|uniref:Helix-turn-helix domain-containing protein n=2 Tax=Paenibacillus TaxID=44249 RepID=A0A7X2ZFQ3_9BACL|nr:MULTISPECIES: helix-turn-helix transcriptional regulator [Paenibacillus]MED4603975.1 helix-turn-helix transcriptional regulator [Paenibacillus validus]MED4609505.1 helix-turn-helix transcriptional regulator [Paenibacillus validus]MUG74057.1 helix-turn-helix domain-containing protein [Paenibacillus validus]
MRIIARTNAVVKARIVKGLTQRQLAERSGLSYAYVSLLERSMKTVGPGTAKKLSEVLERPMEELFQIE